MKQFNTEPKIPKDTSNFESLIDADLAVLEARHKEIIKKMFKEEISAEPNIGKLEGIYDDDTVFPALSDLKKNYGSSKWNKIAGALARYLNKEGGKKLRPLLLFNAYRTFARERKLSQAIIDAGVGLEIFHETALFLDDVMDNGTLRRGVPSLWVKIEKLPELNSLNSLDAKKITADLGSLSFSWARHLMIDGAGDKTKSQISEVFWQALSDMKSGQDDDNRLAQSEKWPSLEHVLEQFNLKTASYSMRLPLLYAFHSSFVTPDKNVLEGIDKFCRGFGLAFQLHDDLLITMSDKDIGKSATLDMFNGTKIPIAILARQLGNKKEKMFIDKVWGKGAELTAENIAKLENIFKTTGALQKVFEIMSAELKKAESGLDMIAPKYDVSSLRNLLDAGLPWMDDLAKQVDLK